jgi:hypothetical protein
LKRAGRALAVAAALGMLAYRLAQVDLAPFARDEPQFLAAAREQLRTGHWLSANPLYGNLGLRYGPAAFWFYGVVQALLGDDPRTAILAMGLTVTLAQLALVFALTRLLDESAVFLAVLVAWMASSPYQFLWSRLAWDLTSNAAAFAAAALLCTYRDLRPGRALALGVALGLGLSTHPMVAPLAIAVLLVIAWESRPRGRGGFAPAAVLVASMVAVNVPYLLYVLRAPIVARTARQPLTVAGLGSLLLEAPRMATTWGFAYYFDGAWTDFRTWLGAVSGALDTLSVFSLTVGVVGAVAGVAVALRSSDPRQRRMGRVAAVTWVGNILLLAVLGLARHPHYFFASAWVPVFGVAAGLARLRRARPRAGAAALALLGLVAVAQFAVIVRWMGYIRDRGGTRSASYGTPLGLQRDAMRAACATPETLVVIRNETEMFRFPFEYLATTEASCRDKRVVVCATTRGPFTRPCPPPEMGGRLVRLGYARDPGGTLTVD